MKKFLSVFLSGALLLSLAACGEKAPTAFDPVKDVQTLLDTNQVFAETLEAVDQATACALYGIDEATVTASAVYMANATSAEEVAIFTLADEAATQAAATQLGYRIDDRIDELTSYLPGEVPKLEEAVVETRGNSVLLLVCSDYDGAKKVLEK